MIFWWGCPASSSAQCLRGYSYGEFRIGWSKNGLDMIERLIRRASELFDCLSCFRFVGHLVGLGLGRIMSCNEYEHVNCPRRTRSWICSMTLYCGVPNASPSRISRQSSSDLAAGAKSDFADIMLTLDRRLPTKCKKPLIFGAPEEIRTPDPPFFSPVLSCSDHDRSVAMSPMSRLS